MNIKLKARVICSKDQAWDQEDKFLFHKEYGDWVYSDQVQYVERFWYWLRMNLLDPATVCVATGKTDKDGDEIYEGDILEVTGTHFTKGNRYEVIWAACAFRLMPERHRHSAKVCYQVLDVWPGDTTFAYKRIGNIHDKEKS